MMKEEGPCDFLFLSIIVSRPQSFPLQKEKGVTREIRSALAVLLLKVESFLSTLPSSLSIVMNVKSLLSFQTLLSVIYMLQERSCEGRRRRKKEGGRQSTSRAALEKTVCCCGNLLFRMLKSNREKE